MPKKVSEQEKIKIHDSFIDGLDIKKLSELYGFSIPTITKQLKNKLGNEKFKNIKEQKNKKNESSKKNPLRSKIKLKEEDLTKNISTIEDSNEQNKTEQFSRDQFYEILPLNYEIDLENQKDLSSVHLDEVEFPKIIYMIVDAKIELVIKLLKDYPQWDFLSEFDLNRKTIEIYFDFKKAKKNCKKDQKIIKVPNTNVFKIVSPILLSRGISRILTEDQLISL